VENYKYQIQFSANKGIRVGFVAYGFSVEGEK